HGGGRSARPADAQARRLADRGRRRPARGAPGGEDHHRRARRPRRGARGGRDGAEAQRGLGAGAQALRGAVSPAPAKPPRTLTRTGTPAVFLHPADALHGDAGLFGPGDAALFVSKSGGSEELLALMPYLERHGIPLVSLIATPRSPLAAKSRVALVTGPVRE